MLETEYIKSLQSNYARIRLAERPDDRRYQYCILTRGGIKGLLPCSLRYINALAFLYYDITSKQNMAQMYGKQLIDRKWVLSFFRSLRQVNKEVARFLLDEKNIMVCPEYIFQDVGSKNFYFLYLPYSTEDNGIMRLLDFLIEHMDYEDERLVECVYGMYEELGKLKEAYLQGKIFEDAEKLAEDKTESRDITRTEPGADIQEPVPYGKMLETEERSVLDEKLIPFPGVSETEKADVEKHAKISLWERISGKKRKENEKKQSYREAMLNRMEGIAVAEEPVYDEEDYGQTVYMERAEEEDSRHKLYTPDGRVAVVLESDTLLIGKQKDEVDMVLEDESVSRIHARISIEEGMICLEDLNSTNGTFKNGLRLQPYEKRRIEENDEIRIGKRLFIFR